MADRYRTLSAVFPVFLQPDGGKTRILLAKRANTGYMDGMWDFAGSGHVDEGETATSAVINECREELGIEVNAKDISLAHFCHRLGINGARTYYDLYFYVKEYTGTPFIAEPDKCDGLAWFFIDDLPEDMIILRQEALSHILAGTPYSEFIADGLVIQG